MLPVETEFRAREMELRSFILQNISSGPLYTSLCRMLGAFETHSSSLEAQSLAKSSDL